MTTVLAITQFVLLTLGTIFFKGMVNANGDITSSSYFQFLDRPTRGIPTSGWPRAGFDPCEAPKIQ